MKTSLGTARNKQVKLLRVLLDSGCSATIINSKFTEKLRVKRNDNTKWSTQAGNFETSKLCKIQFTLPEFHQTKIVEWNAHVNETTNPNSHYDIIIGRDLMI